MNREQLHLEQLFIEAEGAPLSPKELRQYRRLAELLSGWRVLGERIEWKDLSGNISAKVRDDAAARASARVDQTIDPSITSKAVAADPALVREYRAVDDLLQSVAAPMPRVDWKAFSNKVSSAVRHEAKVVNRHKRFVQRRVFNWSLRVAIPLAAAAVLFAFWPARPIATPVVKGPPTEPKSMVVVTLDQPRKSDGKVSVTFDETKPPVGNEAPMPVTAIAIGPPRAEAVDIPIDPALLP